MHPDPSTLRPIRDGVILRIIPRETASGVILPVGERKWVAFAEVLKVGTGMWFPDRVEPRPPTVNPGEYVALADYGYRKLFESDKGIIAHTNEGALWGVVKFEGAPEEHKVATCRPLHGKVLVKLYDDQKTLSGLLHLPKRNLRAYARGVVRAVGPGWYHPETGEQVPPEVAVGDEVEIEHIRGGYIRVGGEQLIFGHQGEILCKWKRNGAKNPQHA